MTWAERVGDLGTSFALLVINLIRVFTLLLRLAAARLDQLVTSLGERSEEGLRPTTTSASAWVRLPASVLWGIAAIVLRALSIFTVFLRQLTAAVDEFFRTLAEGEVGGPVA